MKNLLLILCLLFTLSNYATAQYDINQSVDLEVNVDLLASNKGWIALQLLDASNKKVASAYVNISEGQGKVKFSYLKPGEYAVRLFHDENGNGIMETNFLSIPTEGYGFSNNSAGIMGMPPDFEDMLFSVIGDTKISITPIY